MMFHVLEKNNWSWTDDCGCIRSMVSFYMHARFILSRFNMIDRWERAAFQDWAFDF